MMRALTACLVGAIAAVSGCGGTSDPTAESDAAISGDAASSLQTVDGGADSAVEGDGSVPAPGGGGTSGYKTVGSPIVYDFTNPGAPAKCATRIEPTTGATVRRLTDVSTDAPGLGNLYNAYSRYSAENVTGEYVLAITGQTVRVVNRITCAVSAPLSTDGTHPLGDYHETRWHMTAAHPYRVYFRDGQKFMMIDDVRNPEQTRSLIKDFSSVIAWHPGAGSDRWVYCDQECNSSHDSDHWAFMAAVYNGSTFEVRAFIHYQISTDKVDLLYPSGLAGVARAPAGESGRDTFRYRPNTIEPAPDGSGILIHHARAYPGASDEYIGSIFEAPSFWPNDFKTTTFAPFRMGSDATHSGWGMVQGKWYLLQQDNRRDKLMAVPIAGPNKGYGAEGQLDVNVGLNTAGIIDFFDDNDYSFTNGMHFTSQGPATDGWALVATYSDLSATSKGRANALELMQIKPVNQNPARWHISPTFNLWPLDNKADYNEGAAAFNMAGTRIHVPGDWGGTLGHVETLEIPLPDDWRQHFAP